MNTASTTAAEATHLGAIAAQIRKHCDDADAAEGPRLFDDPDYSAAIARMWDVYEQAPHCAVTNARDALIAAILLRDQALALVAAEQDPSTAEQDVAHREAQVIRFAENLIRGLEQLSGAKAAELLPWFASEMTER